jgi:hypothetical protein
MYYVGKIILVGVSILIISIVLTAVLPINENNFITIDTVIWVVALIGGIILALGSFMGEVGIVQFITTISSLMPIMGSINMLIFRDKNISYDEYKGQYNKMGMGRVPLIIMTTFIPIIAGGFGVLINSDKPERSY